MKCRYCNLHYPNTIGFKEEGVCDVCGANLEQDVRKTIDELQAVKDLEVEDER